jgi:histone H3/H4
VLQNFLTRPRTKKKHFLTKKIMEEIPNENIKALARRGGTSHLSDDGVLIAKLLFKHYLISLITKAQQNCEADGRLVITENDIWKAKLME